MTTIILTFSPLTTAATGNPELGQKKAEVCAACHGLDGISPTPIWPNLAGQHPLYLAKELRDYKGEKALRTDPSMTPQAMSLTDGDIDDLAAYFANQKPAEGKAKKELVALGEKIYRGGDPKRGVPACLACHGPDGKGNALANYPSLSGQHPDYTVDQLKKFRTGVRKNDANNIMQDIAKLMTDEEITAVSSYVSGLH